MIVDKDGNFLLEANLRALVRDVCHTPLCVAGQSVAVDELQRMEHEYLRPTIATPHELLNALTLQMRWIQFANDYLKTQIPHLDVVDRALDEASRGLRGG